MIRFMILSAPERIFSIEGSVLVIVALLGPFGIAWMVSVYENRFLYYLSEGRQALSKGAIILSVLSSVCVPIFCISFGLLGLARIAGYGAPGAATSDGSSIAEGVVNRMGDLPPDRLAFSIGLTLIASIMFTGWLHGRISRRAALERAEDQRMLSRWFRVLVIASQVLILGFFWGVLFLLPRLANVVIT